MLRLHFTAEDLATVRLAPDGSPMGEALMSLQMLRGHGPEPRYGWWRHGLRGRLPAAVRPVWDLVPAHGWIPDFLTPYHDEMTTRSYLAAIRATPPRVLAADLRLVATRLPGWAAGLAHGDAGALAAVADGLAAYHDVAIAPHVERMRAAQDAERAHVATALLHRGVGMLLARLHPDAVWRAPVLVVPSSVEGDIHLAGRGLILAPMVFCGPRTRLWLGDADGPALLAYPLAFDNSVNPLVEATTRSLAKVLGVTRTTVLTAVAAAPGLTTAELANRARVSLASASEHATLLREAGLVTSQRDRNRVRHYPTGTAMHLVGVSGAG